MNALQDLNERSLVYQMTNEEKLNELLAGESLSFYIGFDATAKSLHLGHLVPLMIASHLQKAGHKPHILIGGATALVGDPSGRSTERTLESRKTVKNWAACLKEQMTRFLTFGSDGSGAVMLDNSDWLTQLNYIDFLRNVGRHFSVNRMLTAESVKTRLETGLSFLEFNYMLLQSYDFLHLFRNHRCILQVGEPISGGTLLPASTSSEGKRRRRSMVSHVPW